MDRLLRFISGDESVTTLRLESFKYKYISLVLVGVIVAMILASNQPFQQFVHGLGTLEYVGALIAGLLFVSSFTIPAATVMIAILAADIHPFAIAFIGGLGAVIGDILIYKFVKDHLAEELIMLFGKEGTSYVKSVFKSKYINWTLPIIGALVIASPLPDELGISLLGLSKISPLKFVLISYASNFFGVLMVASVARVL